jgi:hypothetical protein
MPPLRGFALRRLLLAIVSAAALERATTGAAAKAHEPHQCIHDSAGIGAFVKRVQPHTMSRQLHASGVPHVVDPRAAAPGADSDAASAAGLRGHAGPNATAQTTSTAPFDAAAQARLLQVTYQSIRITLDLSRLEANG